MRGLSASPAPSLSSFSIPKLKTSNPSSSFPIFVLTPPLPLLSTHFSLPSSHPKPINLTRSSSTLLRCRSREEFSTPGENNSRTVLDAFFLGKALAEAVNEQIESTVGELLSRLGQWQAEQQKQAQNLQEEVFERAKKAKEKAALETMKSEGVIMKSTDDGIPVAPRPDTNEDDPFIIMMKD